MEHAIIQPKFVLWIYDREMWWKGRRENLIDASSLHSN